MVPSPVLSRKPVHCSPCPPYPESPIVADARRGMASRRQASRRILEQLKIDRAPQRQISRQLVEDARERRLDRQDRSRRERRVA